MPYLKTILGLMGLTNVSFINAQPMDMAGPETAEQVLEAKIAEARDAGAKF